MRSALLFLVRPGIARAMLAQDRWAGLWGAAVTLLLSALAGITAYLRILPARGQELPPAAGQATAAILTLEPTMNAAILSIALLGGCRMLGVRTPLGNLLKLSLLSAPPKALLLVAALLSFDFVNPNPLGNAAPLSLNGLLAASPASAAFGIFNYLNLFQLWADVLLIIALASHAEISRIRAFFAVLPSIVLTLLYELFGRVVGSLMIPQ